MWIHVAQVAFAWLLAVVAGGLGSYADVGDQHVNVRWAPTVTDDDRLRLERQFGLIDAERQPERTWSYLTTDRSRARIAALVQHPGVEDTQHIDRSAFSVRLDRPDLPRWVVRLAETEQVDTLAWIVGAVALIASWSRRASLGQAWRALAGNAASRAALALAAIVGGVMLHTLSGRSPLRDLRLAVTGAALVLLSSVLLADSERRARRLTVAAIAAGALAFGAAFAWHVTGRLGRMTVFSDWDHFLTLHWVAYETVRNYGQVPLWNPYVCGGIPMLGNPQSRWLTPFFLLHLLFGPELALQLEIVAHISIAWVGALLLGRVAGLSWLAALAPATVFAGSSYVYLHLAEGHATWLVYAYMPGILAAAASNRPVLAGIGLALAIGEGGVYPVLHTVLALGVLALHRGIAERSIRPLTNFGVTMIMAACVAAPKLLLMQPLLAGNPRLIEPTESVSLELVARAFLDPNQDLFVSVPDDQPRGFQEFGAYVGSIPLVLAIYGLIAAGRRTVPWLLLFAVGLALSLGATLGGPYSPWALLHHLPVFASLRIPSRLLVLSVLAVGMLAGFGIDRLVSARGTWRMAIAIALLAMATLDLALVSPPILRRLGDGLGETLQASASFVQVSGGDRKQMYAAARANMGSLSCYEPLGPAVVAPIGVNTPQYRGEQYLLHGGTVGVVDWSPNRMVLAVSSMAPNILVVNYNYDAFWHVVSGEGQTFDHEGLLGVSVPAGSQELVLVYQPLRFTAGLLLAFAALGVAAWMTLRR